jgi:hypothetical protein
LQTLDLSGTAVTNRGLDNLHRARRLRFLDIIDCKKITADAISRLKKMIPGISVYSHLQ